MRRLTTALLLLLVPFTAQASLESRPFPGPKDQNLLFGAQAWYQVVLRTEGSSVVTGRVTLPNDPELGVPRELSLDLGVEPRDLSVYYEQRSTCSLPDEQPTSTCQYTGYEAATYTKLSPVQTGTKLQLALPETPASAVSGGVLFSFATNGYTKERFGRFSYEVSSPKLELRTQSVTVALSVDPGTYITDKQATVYSGAATSSSMPPAQQVGSGSSRDASLRAVADSLSYGYGQVYETANSLAAGDVLTMRGYLSESRFFLELPRYTMGLAAFLILGALVALGLSLLKRRRPELAANLRPVTWASFFGAAGTVLLSSLLSSASNYFGAWQYQFLIPFTLVTIFAAFVALTLLPSLLVGFARRSWVLGLGTFGAQVLWSLIFLLVLSLVGMQSGGQGPILY